ncbi:MAG TPA: translocation/assembly module TamB domain-containing protein [Bryobacteraceae bacterium]|jgi:translocation and assembly module TamB|nr:translocation/assembly module TamB domain-containing protein [Bryobacteraceae bacterium]
MSKRKKVVIGIVLSLVGLLLIAIIGSLIVVQTAWFSNFVRQKIIASVEESTGGTVDIRSFRFDPWHLTVKIEGFVLHGTEPKTAKPLARIALLEIHLKLFSGIAHSIDLAYAGVQAPEVNVITFPDGSTNFPTPKVKSSSNGNALQTVVDLKIGEFKVQNGSLDWTGKQAAFSGHGQNLSALLNYRPATPGYSGKLSIQPLIFSAADGVPLRINVDLPIAIDANSIAVSGGRLQTDQSQVALNASMRDINTPVIDANLNAKLSTPELQKALNLPLKIPANSSANQLTADLQAHFDQKTGIGEVQTARLVFGDTNFQASGRFRDPNNRNEALHFKANFALDQLTGLLADSTVRANGTLIASGDVKLDAQDNYQVDGALSGRDLSVKSADTSVKNVSVYVPVHADPSLINIDGLKAQALGGSLTGRVSLAQMKSLSVDGTLRGFSIGALTSFLAGNRVNYDGTLNGSVNASGDVTQANSIRANANIAIAPGNHGIPVRGDIRASYSAAANNVDIAKSYIGFPSSRIDLSGSLNRQIQIGLVSRNLRDFQPLLALGSKEGASELPIALRANGLAKVDATIAGNLKNPKISARVAVDAFNLEQRAFDSAGLDIAASPSGASIQNGTLTRGALRTSFDASIGLRKWSPVPRSPLQANLILRNGSLSDLLSMAGQSDIPATGDATADVHINGTYGDPLGSAVVQITDGSVYQQPFSRLGAQIQLQDQLISISRLEMVTDAGTVDVSANYRHPKDSFLVGDADIHVRTTPVDLDKLKRVQELTQGLDGTLRLTADAAASIRIVNGKSSVNVSNVNADMNADRLKLRKQDAGDLALTARTSNGRTTYQFTSNFGGSKIALNGQTALTNDYPTTITASIQNLSLHKSLEIAGDPLTPVAGILSADAHVSGTLQSPQADATFTLVNTEAYQEKINRVAGTVRYTNQLVDIPSIEVDAPAGRVTLAGSFVHPANVFSSGTVNLAVKTPRVDLAKVEHIHQQQPTLGGLARLNLDFSGSLAQGQSVPFLLKRLNADIAANGLEMNHRNVGTVGLNATTSGSTVNFRFDSDLADSRIRAEGASQLTGKYPTRATLSFRNVDYANIEPLLAQDPTVQPTFDATVEGDATLNGPLLDEDALTARLELTKLVARTIPAPRATGGPTRRAVSIENKGPVVVSLKRSVLTVQNFSLAGEGTNVSASGSVNIKDQSGAMDLALAANLDLSALQSVDPDFYSNGAISVNAAVRGNLAKPALSGRIELKNANINYAEFPNGLSNGNGLILLTGTGANIQSLTGETGGGKIAVTGSASYSGSRIIYNLKAAANKVRFRYSGLSITSNSAITLTGNTNRSLLAGNVTVTRIAYNSSSDVGSLLSSFAATPVSTPTAPNPILSGMRLNVRILTAPDLRVVTTYAERLSVQANLAVRGTATIPGMVGQVTVTDGQLVFFGNTYTVTTGTIGFYNPSAIQPVLNISLETLAQGVDVTLTVSGTMSNLQLAYTSDPPLTFEQIVQLLATNTTPNDPNIVANQPPAPQQSFTQMGESAILGQAIANPLASRVQRVFGLSQFKIDPTVAGANGPTARVTLQQKIANNITFTYITDVTETNSEIIRVQWDLTPKVSAVGLREFNGNVSVEFFYNFKVR